MVLGMFIGLGLGVTGGVLLGGQVFKGHEDVDEKEYGHLDIRADTDENVAEPAVTGTTNAGHRDILKYAPKWTTWPDFEQVRWLNSTIEWLWPNLTRAICKMAVEIAEPILKDIVANQPMLDEIVIQELDFGKQPLRLAGLKVYDTKDDEVILEAPIQWGSTMKVHVLARVRLGPASIYIPLKVEDLQMSATARITFRPLVDTLPCLGAVSVSLVESPFVDLTVKAINSMDLLALPFVHDAVLMAVKMVTEQIVVYPNQISVPLMENSGLPKPPSGMLEVTINNCTNLKSADLAGSGDPYVVISVHTLGMTKDKHGKEHEIVVKKDPPHETKVKSGKNPEFKEHFKILMPELTDKHVLAIRVMDKDFVGQDDTMAEFDISLDKKNITKDNEFLRDAEERQMTFQLKPKSGTQARQAGNAAGELYCLMQYTPFFNSNESQEDEDDPAKAMERLANQRKTTVINDTSKGVLSVEVSRCYDLPLEGPTCDSFVEFKLSDPDAADGPDVRRTAPIYNERSPRFRAKQDFVYVSATSMLTMTVFDTPGLLEIGNLLKLGRKSDTPLGKVRIPVKDVAKTGRMKDSFPLQEADQGDMKLTLSWLPVERDD